MATGIIPWNATPGKACGSTLGEICSTSEVRRCFLSSQIDTNAIHTSAEESGGAWHHFFKLEIFTVVVFFQFYLSYHLYIVACAGAGATVIALVSFPPVSPSLSLLVHLCTVCISRSCVKCSSCHSHMVCVTAARKITRRLFLSSNSICCLPSA